LKEALQINTKPSLDLLVLSGQAKRTKNTKSAAADELISSKIGIFLLFAAPKSKTT